MNLVSLNEEDEFDFVEGKGSRELGALFKVYQFPEEEFLLKITITPQSQIAFQIAIQNEKRETEQFAEFAL